jgi:hypothetical protein
MTILDYLMGENFQVISETLIYLNEKCNNIILKCVNERMTVPIKNKKNRWNAK